MTQYTLTVQPDDVDKGKWMVVIHGDKLIGIPARGLSKAEAASRLQCLIPARGLSKAEAASRLQCLAFAFEFGLREATACVGAMRWTVSVDTMKEGT